MTDLFLINLSRVLAHSMVFEHRREAAGDPLNINILAPGSEFMQEEPKVPKFNPVATVNPGVEAGRAIRGNIQRFGDVSKLGSEVNAFNQSELEKMLESAMPGYKNLVGGIASKIGGFLNGEIPKDVSDAIGRNSAWQSMSGGYGGSGMGRNLVARDLGLTSLQMMEKGVDVGSRWLATARGALTAPQFDVGNMFLTPAQQIAAKQGNANIEMFNSTGQFQRDWMQNQLDSEYDPMTIFSKGAERDQAMWDNRMNSTMSSL